MNVRLLDLASLLQAGVRAAKEKEWHDADATMESIRSQLNVKIWVSQPYVESLLSAMLVLEEAKVKWHPDGLTAYQLVQKLTPSGMRYDKDYRIFVKLKD